MTVIAKSELLFVGTFGVAAWLAGLTFINRHSGDKGKKTINDAMAALKEKNVKLWVFPEGTRRTTGEIHPFKKGAFHAAVQAQVPIVPVVFSSYRNFLDTKKKIFTDGEIIITALPEIPTKGLTAADVDDLLVRTRNIMVEVYAAASSETEKKLNLN